MTTTEAEPETAHKRPIEQLTELPDRGGDVRVAITPRQMAFMAVIAGVILALLRRAAGRRRSKANAPDSEG